MAQWRDIVGIYEDIVGDEEEVFHGEDSKEQFEASSCNQLCAWWFQDASDASRQPHECLGGSHLEEDLRGGRGFVSARGHGIFIQHRIAIVPSPRCRSADPCSVPLCRYVIGGTNSYPSFMP